MLKNAESYGKFSLIYFIPDHGIDTYCAAIPLKHSRQRGFQDVCFTLYFIVVNHKLTSYDVITHSGY